MDEILSKVKIALRIKNSTAYDDELTVYIKACLYDLNRLNIVYNEESPEDEIITCVICYVKSKFGSGNESYKESMRLAYEDLRMAIFLDKSHRW